MLSRYSYSYINLSAIACMSCSHDIHVLYNIYTPIPIYPHTYVVRFMVHDTVHVSIPARMTVVRLLDLVSGHEFLEPPLELRSFSVALLQETMSTVKVKKVTSTAWTAGIMNNHNLWYSHYLSWNSESSQEAWRGLAQGRQPGTWLRSIRANYSTHPPGHAHCQLSTCSIPPPTHHKLPVMNIISC